MIISLSTAFMLAGGIIFLVFWIIDYVVNHDLEVEDDDYGN
ncbi:MAG: hypothetical protein WBI40_04570 [Methylococcaceae bacterium]